LHLLSLYRDLEIMITPDWERGVSASRLQSLRKIQDPRRQPLDLFEVKLGELPQRA
jgi:hypothetical protein